MSHSRSSSASESHRAGIGPFGRGLLMALDHISAGELTLQWPDGRTWQFTGGTPGPQASATVRNPAAVRRAILGGSVGLAEGYMAGQWDTPALTPFLEFCLTNLDAASGGWIRSPLTPVNRLIHALRDNTRSGSRKNIEYHYDLGNDFYALWLDPDMTYSCALFDGSGCDLAEAQRRKWDRLLSLLEVRPGQTLLEIGCGWGGFAVHAAKTLGARVTGITLSREQHDWALRRAAEEGASDLVEIRLQDYRDVTERYDHVASIEMFEAVGEKWWPTFFAAVRDRLVDGGRAALQTITIADDRLDGYRSSPDFIQRYIFPGGMLPSPTVFRSVAADAGLACGEPFFFGRDYAMTLHAWEERFTEVVERVRALGFDERFERLWRFYLAYCQAGFRHGAIDVMQVAMTRA